jgi:hypothetical protein
MNRFWTGGLRFAHSVDKCGFQSRDALIEGYGGNFYVQKLSKFACVDADSSSGEKI